MRRFAVIVSLLFAVFLVPIVAQDTEIIGPDEYPDTVNPLTGLTVDNPAVLNQRPLIVKMPNAPAEARPQWGVLEADIVYEYLIAGGYTRFAPVFLSNAPERVGPVRSLRLVDIDLVKLNGALIAASGASDGTWETIYADNLVPDRLIVGESYAPAFLRDDSIQRSREFTLVGNVPALRELAEDLDRDTDAPNLTGFAFSDSLEGGIPLTDFTIKYAVTEVHWYYDAETNQYLRDMDGEQHIVFDANNEAVPLTFDNVVMLEANHDVAPYTREGYWGYSNFAYSVPFNEGGRVFLLRDGNYYQGTWQRLGDGLLRFYDETGQVLPFQKGRTLFQMLPRWIEGYQLTLRSPEEPTGNVTSRGGVNLRWGPSSNYSAGDAAFPDDDLSLIGRNNRGTWLQVALPDDARALWVSADFVSTNVDIFALPITRPTVED